MYLVYIPRLLQPIAVNILTRHHDVDDVTMPQSMRCESIPMSLLYIQSE